MRRTWLIAPVALMTAALLTPAGAAAQQISRCDASTPEFTPVTAPPRYEIGPQETFSLVSARDGVAIDVAVFRPRVPVGERVPVILNATPYHHAMRTLDVRRCKPELVDNFVPQGYAVAFVAVRGTGDSGGCMNLFGPAERGDVDQTVSWLAAQPWSSGAVGMIGKSYEGGTPWMPAAAGNPYLKTIVSVAGVPDVFDLLYANGNIDIRGPLLLADLYFLPSVVTYADGRSVERTLEVAACPEYAVANAASMHSSLTGELDPFGYFAARRYTDAIVANYRGSVFLAQGFDDLNVPPGVQFDLLARLRARGVPIKLWLGQWGHVNPDEAGGDAQRLDWPDTLLTWFDRWLRGVAVDTGPAVEVQDSTGAWRSEAAWPPSGSPQTLWLGGDGSLRSTPGGARSSRLLVLDPLHVETGPLLGRPALPRDLDSVCALPTCSAFVTAPLDSALRFGGRPELRLTVTPAAPAGHVSAYLYADDGRGAQRIGWGQADIRFPRGDERRAPVTPGRPVQLSLRLQPTDAVVPAGSRLSLVLSQGAAYDRIPSLPTAPLTVTVGGDASSLVLERVAASPRAPSPARRRSRPAACRARRSRRSSSSGRTRTRRAGSWTGRAAC